MKHLFLYSLLLISSLCIGQNAKTEIETFVPKKENYSFITINFRVPAFDRKQKVDSVSFEGSLIIPKAGFDKVVIIKPGTGYNTRNTHSYLAEALLDHNVAVFRYDERGKGNSEGEGGGDMLYTSTMMGVELASAFNILKRQRILQDKKFGVIGHSMGGIAIMDAYAHSFNPDFLVILSSPVVSGRDFFLYQLRQEGNGFQDYFVYDTQQEKENVYNELVDFYIANKDKQNYWKLYKKKAKEIGYTDKRSKIRFKFLIGRAEKDLVLKDNRDKYRKLTIPTFYMIGDQDVLVDPVRNVELLTSFHNKNITIEVLEGENHFFADGESYDIHQVPKQKVVDWVLKQ